MLNHSDIITPEVITTLREGNHQAFELLYVTFRKPLKRFVQKLSGSAELADEIIQEVFTVVWEQRKKLDAGKNIKSYLFTITKRIALRHIYQTGPFDEVPEGFTASIPQDTNTEKILEAQEMQLLIEVAVNRMPEIRRRVFDLYREGFDHSEIAEQLEMSPESVRQNIFRARKDIKELIVLVLFFLVIQ